MKEFDEIYRDMLAAHGVIAEGIQSMLTLDRRERERLEDIKEDGNMWKARAEAAEAEVAALKAQLAAQWRPVTEDEPPIGNRVILRHLPVIRLDADRWLNSDGIEFWHEDGAAVYWQPAPPQKEG